MTDTDLHGACSLYVLGALEDADRETFERHLTSGCERCARELAEARGALAVLADSGPTATPDPSLRDRLFERIRAEPFIFFRATEGVWT